MRVKRRFLILLRLRHSLGEYSALCSLNVLNLRDTTWILEKRGEAMQNSVEISNKMVAVLGLDILQIERENNETNFQ